MTDVQEASPSRSATGPAWLPWLLAALCTLPALVLTFPIGPDLGMHFYSISALRNFGNREMFPEGLLELQLGQANQLFFLIAYALSFVVSLTWSVKLAVALASALYILGAARLCAYLGRSLWVLGLVVPISLGFSYYFGLQAYQLATGLLLASLVDVDRYSRRPTLGHFLRVMLWVPVFHLAHQQALVIFSGAFLVFAPGYASSWKGLAQRALPFFAGLAMASLMVWAQQDQLNQTAIISQAPYFAPLGARLRSLPVMLFGAHMHTTRDGIALVFLGCLLALAYFRLRSERPSWLGLHEALRTWRFELLALCNLLFFLAAPNSINTANYIAERFLPWAALLAVITLAPADLGLPRVMRAVLLLVPMGYGAALVPALREVETQVRHLEQLMPFIQKGSSIALLDADIAEPDVPFTTVYGDAFIAAQLGGRPLHSFLYSPISVVRFREDTLWHSSLQRLLLPKTFNFRPKLDFTAFRYVLVKSQSVAKNQLITRLLGPEGRFVASTGNWTLIESTLPVRPLTAPFGRPGFSGDSVGDRFIQIIDLVNEEDWLREGLVEGGACTPDGGLIGKPIEEILAYMDWAHRQSLAGTTKQEEVASNE